MFPNTLTDKKQWIVWRLEQYEGDKKPRKVPYYINGRKRFGKQGDEQDLSQLASFHEAKEAVSKNGYSGLGFALVKGDGLICIDIDSNADKQIVEKIIAGLDSYTEVSPSGNGYHIWVAGETRTFKSNDVGIEVFCGAQFITMTGNKIESAPFEVNLISDLLLERLRIIVKGDRDTQPKQREYTPVIDEAQKIESALAYISSDCGYHDWVRVGAAIYDALGSSGFGIWDYWSSKAGSYSPEGMQQKYETFASMTDIHAPTIYKMAIDNGWRPPKDPNWKPEPRRLQNSTPLAQPQAIEQTVEAPSADADAETETQPLKQFNNRTIDFYSPLTYPANDQGKPLAIIENFEEILERIGALVRYNVIKKDEEILIPDESFTMDNEKNASIARIISRCAQFKFPTGNVSDFITYIADKNQYNPVAVWVESKEWDGDDRLTELLNTVKPTSAIETNDGEMLHHVLIKRWMISAVASAFSPNGVSSAGVLVFQGDQGLGKTAWFKSLVPKDMDLTKDGLQLRLDDKDSVKEALSYWLVELGELDGTFNKSEMAALKAFLTKGSDEMRQAYARKSSKFARRTVFFASVNPDKFLKDPTGNRRYWTVACDSIDYEHNIDMQQVWAQVYDIWQSGEGYYLKPSELNALNESNDDFTEVDPIEEMLLSRYDWEATIRDWRWVTVTDALIAIGFHRPSVGDCRKAGSVIRKLNEGQERKSNGKKLIFCPPLTDYWKQQNNNPL